MAASLKFSPTSRSSARSPGRVEDLDRCFSVLRGYDPVEPSSLSALARMDALPERCRIAYLPRMGLAPVDPLIAHAATNSPPFLAAAGHRVEAIETPYDPDSVGRAWGAIAAAGLHWHLKTVGSARGWARTTLAIDEAGAACAGSDYAGAIR